MKPILIILALVALALLLVQTRYSFHAASGTLPVGYRLDHWTGTVRVYCGVRNNDAE
jgi:hypothetical protein